MRRCFSGDALVIGKCAVDELDRKGRAAFGVLIVVAMGGEARARGHWLRQGRWWFRLGTLRAASVALEHSTGGECTKLEEEKQMEEVNTAAARQERLHGACVSSQARSLLEAARATVTSLGRTSNTSSSAAHMRASPRIVCAQPWPRVVPLPLI